MENKYESPILIVDDNADLMVAYNHLLSKNGYKVVCTETGKGALELVEKETFSLILLDVVLPDISGMEVLRIIKSNPEHENIFVVLISSLATTSAEQSEGLETGADGYLLKPIENREFLARIEAFIRHKRTMDKLRASEFKFKMLANSNIDGILIIDADNRIVFANPASEKLFRNGKKSIINTQIGNPFPEDGILEITKSSGISAGRTVEIRSSDLEWDGKAMKLISLRDITDRLHAQHNLRLSEERWHSLVESSPDFIALIDNQCRYLYLNRYAVGFNKNEVIGKSVFSFVSPDSVAIFKQKIHECFDTLTVQRLDIHAFGDNETVRVYDLHLIPMKTAKNEINLLIDGRDITESRQAETALIESERFLQETQTIARLGSFVWDLSTGLWKSSIMLDEIFGIDKDSVRTLDGWADIVHPAWRDIMTDYVKNYVIGKHQKFDKEYQIIRKNDGQERWVHGIAELELDHNNRPVRLIGTISDVTGRRQAEEALKQKIDELERFNDLTVGRELKMIELKKEINALLIRLDEKVKYKIVV